jgi:hypothetical protein
MPKGSARTPLGPCFPQFLVTPEGLLSDQAQIKEDLTVLPEIVVLESSTFKYVPYRV